MHLPVVCSQTHSGTKISTMGRNCTCQNLLTARRRFVSPAEKYSTRWAFAFEVTKELGAANNATEQKPKLVLLGDSITEHWTGMRNRKVDLAYADHAAVFKEILTKEGGGKFNSIPLGISGDRVSERMYETWSSPTRP